MRPLPAFPLLPTGVMGGPVPAASGQPQKKEKPLTKTPIPGTDWLRVKTTKGNVFYTNKSTKTSVWTVPEEIKDALIVMEREEEESKAHAAREAQAKADEARKRMEEEKAKRRAAVLKAREEERQAREEEERIRREKEEEERRLEAGTWPWCL